jgi:ABC-2 type transport system ATP-binding protein
MIIATALTKYIDPIIALDHLTLHVRPGEIYCLLGPNGSGKSTTINLFFGFIKPTRGSASICGFDAVRQSLEVKKHAALVSESFRFYHTLTAIEHLACFAALAGRRDLKRQDLVQLLRSVALPERSFDQGVGEFSKGMKQKLAIAIALLKNAPALLLDEPSGGLDPTSAADLVRLLREMRNGGKAILMATHDVFHARQIADTVGFLREGVLILELRRPDFVHEDLEKLYLKYVAGWSGL